MRLQRRLTEAARNWPEMNRDPGELYRGARLVQALEWTNQSAHAKELNELEQVFMQACKAEAQRETAEREAQRQREVKSAQKLVETEKMRAEEQLQSNKRLRKRAIFLTTAFMLAGILALVAGIFWQRTIQANKLATSRELSAAAVNNLQVDPERSTLPGIASTGNSGHKDT